MLHRRRVPKDESAAYVLYSTRGESPIRRPTCICRAANGCKVIEAPSGEEAVALIDGHDQQLDVLFTDIRLGGPLNGWDVAEIFRAHFPTIRVLYASGYSIGPPRQVPESEFFNKPYRPEDILRACTKYRRAVSSYQAPGSRPHLVSARSQAVIAGPA
jgi:CheY-like chemotaxis protein